MILRVARVGGDFHIASPNDQHHRHNSAHTSLTHIIMCKHQLLSDAGSPSILPVEPVTVLSNNLPEDSKFHSTYQSTFLPLVRTRLGRSLSTFQNLFVEIRDYLFTSILPLVPISPNEGTFVSLSFEQLNTIMKFAHTLGNVSRCFRHSKVLCPKRPRMEKLLESAISECP